MNAITLLTFISCHPWTSIFVAIVILVGLSGTFNFILELVKVFMCRCSSEQKCIHDTEEGSDAGTV